MRGSLTLQHLPSSDADVVSFSPPRLVQNLRFKTANNLIVRPSPPLKKTTAQPFFASTALSRSATALDDTAIDDTTSPIHTDTTSEPSNNSNKTTSTSKMPPSFMSFPVEIRLKIYAALLVPDAPISLSSVIYNQPDTDPSRVRVHTNILSTSRRINHEATQVFWAQNCFSLDHQLVISLLKLYNPPRRRTGSNSSSSSTGSQQNGSGLSRGNVREKLSNVRRMQYRMACSLQKHPQPHSPTVSIDTPRCVHVVFNSQSTLRDIVQLFFTPEQQPRQLELVLDAGAMSKDFVSAGVDGGEEGLLVDFEHAQLKKLNYKSEDPPWSHGDTVDVVVGALRGLREPHAVTLRMDTTLKERSGGGSEEAVRAVRVVRRELTQVLADKMAGNTTAKGTVTASTLIGVA